MACWVNCSCMYMCIEFFVVLTVLQFGPIPTPQSPKEHISEPLLIASTTLPRESVMEYCFVT